MAGAVADLERALSVERGRLDTARTRLVAARRSSEAATPGGLTGYDSAVLSGTRRRPNHRADRRRHAAYDRETQAAVAVTEAERRVSVAERQLERAKADAAAPCDLSALKPGWFIRDRHGWHKVARVNAKTVSVETGFSWTDRIVETREPSEDRGDDR